MTDAAARQQHRSLNSHIKGEKYVCTLFFIDTFQLSLKTFYLCSFPSSFQQKVTNSGLLKGLSFSSTLGMDMDGLFSIRKNRKNHLAYCLLWQNSCCCRRIFLMMHCNANLCCGQNIMRRINWNDGFDDVQNQFRISWLNDWTF